jgi:hypothetical protein
MNSFDSVIPFPALQAAVRAILEKPAGYEWTVQGFGFIRTYFGSKRWRLNVWDSTFKVPNVSLIHDHPWHLTSWVISGELTNKRYLLGDGLAPTHSYMTIHTGVEFDGSHGEYLKAHLISKPLEVYHPGDTYSQTADEVHETSYLDGTVTFNERLGDTEHARVFWPYGEEWVDAKPRAARLSEIASIAERAIEQWNQMSAEPVKEPVAKKSSDSSGGIWLTGHKTQLGLQWAIFHDPIPKFLAGAALKERLDIRPDWGLLTTLSLAEKVKVVFGK